MIFLPHGKSYLFLQNFEKALLEILMCSSLFCLSWKIYMCSYTIFGSPIKFDVLIKELCLLLENQRCSCYIQASWKICVFQKSLLKSRSWKKRTDILAKQFVCCFWIDAQIPSRQMQYQQINVVPVDRCSTSRLMQYQEIDTVD